MNYKRITKIEQLKRGDIIRHVSGGQSYVVDSTYGDRATATVTKDLTNAQEWEVLR